MNPAGHVRFLVLILGGLAAGYALVPGGSELASVHYANREYDRAREEYRRLLAEGRVPSRQLLPLVELSLQIGDLRSAQAGMDIFRIFDALNAVRNLKTAVNAVLKAGQHARGEICYTTSPVHTMDAFVKLGVELEKMGCHSIGIKDMAGLCRPHAARSRCPRRRPRSR